jgi:hypothetical protein
MSVSDKAIATAASLAAVKLHGRAFYESIGSPKMIIAPMVDRSEFVRIRSVPSHSTYLTDTIGLEDAHQIIHG